jgi:hypothetical protein
MLQKRYQSLLIKHLKEQIHGNISSENPDQELMVFSDPGITTTFFDDLKKEYQNGFFVHITEERTDLKLTAAYIGRYARRPPLSEIRIKNIRVSIFLLSLKITEIMEARCCIH